MGLAEKRMLTEFRANHFPVIEQEIAKATGGRVPLEIKWDEIAFEGKADRYAELWRKLYFAPLLEALCRIGSDTMGRDALRAGIKKIVLANSRGAYYPSTAITFDDGVITIDHCDSNVDDVEPRTAYLIGLLEAKL